VYHQHYQKKKHITAKLTFRQNAPEKPELKLNLLAEIDSKTRPDVVIASSSSGIPSSQFISQCKNPERVLIGHPFNPPHLMPLVEVVPHPGTNAATTATAIEFYNSIGRKAIHIQQEAPGFVAVWCPRASFRRKISVSSKKKNGKRRLHETHTTPSR
jgi:3-hydroxyacyl-CoA dehydrogenase